VKPFTASPNRHLPIALLAALPIFPHAAASAQTVDDTIQLEKIEVSERGVSRANNVLQLREAAATSEAGANPLLSLNRLPGVNVNSSTHYGLRNSDGSGLRLRAFTLGSLGLAVDGVPSSSNNPPNRFFDSENVSSIAVSPGTGDVNTPAAAALGGSINFYTRAPEREPGAQLTTNFGASNLRRIFARFDTGEIAPGVTAFVSGSNTEQLVSFTDSDKPVLKRKKADAQLRYQGPVLSLTGRYSYYKADDHDDRPISGSNYGNWVPYSPGGPTGDLSDRGRHWFYPTLDDGNPNGLASVNYDKNRNGREEHLFSLSALFTPTSALKIAATPYYQERDGYSYGAVPYNTARTFFENAIRAQPGRADIVAPLGYPTHLLAAPNTLPDGIASLASQDAAGDNKPNAREFFVRGHRTGVPLNLSWKAANHTVEAGAWFEREKQSSVRKLHNLVGGVITNPFDWSTYLTVYFDRQIDWQTQQYFAKDTLRLFDDRLALSAGAKAVSVKTDFEGLPDNTYFDRGIRVKRSPTYSDHFLPQVGATFNLTRSEEVFVNYSENFASPSSDVISGSKFVEAQLEAERTHNLDVGLRTAHGKWSASLAGYFIRYKNRIGDVTNFDPLLFGSANTATAFTNVGGVDGRGIELAVAYSPVRHLRLNLAGAWQSLKYQDNYTENSSTGALLVREIKGHTVPNTPRLTANADVTYALGSFFAGVNARYQDRVFLTTSNNQQIPSYTLLGLGFGYDGTANRNARLKNVRIAVNVENLLDRYWFYASGASTALSNGNFSAGTPRAVYFTASTKF
jgi:iron complex outermembrane recepter protein